MRKLLVYLRDYKKECVLAPLFKMLEATFELFVPLVVAAIIDEGIVNADRGFIVSRAGILVLLAMIGLIWAITAQYFAAKAAVGFATKIKHALFEKIQSLSFSEIDRLGTSSMITRMTSDINQVQSGVNLVLRLFLRSPFIVFGAMIMAFTIDVKEALIFVVTIPLLAIVVFGVMLASIPLYKKVQQCLDRVLGSTRENLTGIRVIRAFCREEAEIEAFDEKARDLNTMQKYVGKISALMNPITYIIINGAVIVLIWGGALKVDAGILTQGQVVALYNYMSQILVELIKLANLIINVTKAVSCGNRIQAIFEIEDEEKSDIKQCNNLDKEISINAIADQAGGKDSQDDIKNIQENRKSDQDSIENKTGKDGQDKKDENDDKQDICVSFDRVGLTYKGAGDETLSDITFTAKYGETIGIIGGTGSGKTSLVHMIPRFYHRTGGEIYIDGKNIDAWSDEQLRQKVGIVMQKAVLFQGTIRENLLWGNETATDEELYEALDVAQAREVVDNKEGGLDAEVAQAGKNFSGGQKQRLTIARALVKNPEILILDDSASALDYATDANLRHALKNRKEKCCVFIVSQRTASIQQADKIIVLDDGRAVGIGTHEELLKSCEVYREIYESQYRSEQ